MRKQNLLFFGFLVILVVTTGIYFALKKPSVKPLLERELNIFNWEDYLSEEVIKDFEEKFGVKVNLDIFEDSALIFFQLQSQPDKYDLIIVEDDYFQLMKNLKLLSPLDHQKIPNLKNLKKEARENSFDYGNQYCVPYVVGFTGIVINEKYVKDFDGTRKIFWDEKYKGKISMPNNSVEILINAFLDLGYNLKEPKIEQLKEAKEHALKQKDLVLGYDDPLKQRELLVSEQAWVGYIYTTEIQDVIKRNPNLKFFPLKEGVLLWADSWCIPKDAPHKNLAQAFLNYLLEPEVSARNSQDINVLMLTQGMEEFLDREFLAQTKGLDFPEDKEIFQKSGYITGELLKEEAQIIINQLWAELETKED